MIHTNDGTSARCLFTSPAVNAYYVLHTCLQQARYQRHEDGKAETSTAAGACASSFAVHPHIQGAPAPNVRRHAREHVKNIRKGRLEKAGPPIGQSLNLLLDSFSLVVHEVCLVLVELFVMISDTINPLRYSAQKRNVMDDFVHT